MQKEENIDNLIILEESLPNRRLKQNEKFDKLVGDTQERMFGKRYRGACCSKIELAGKNDIMGAFVKKKENFLVYCGNPGIGKTYFCSAMIEFALRNFKTWRYWREADLLKKVRSSMEEFKGDYLDSLKYYIDDELLFLDDIGSTGMTEWREEVLFYIIDERYNSMKPTIITSNFSMKEFKQNYHPRLYSRLFAKDNFVIEILDGQDLRLT